MCIIINTMTGSFMIYGGKLSSINHMLLYKHIALHVKPFMMVCVCNRERTAYFASCLAYKYLYETMFMGH